MRQTGKKDDAVGIETLPACLQGIAAILCLSNQREKKKRKTTQAVKALPASIKEKRIPRAEAPCIPFTKRNKKEEVVLMDT
eukprot:1148081-Pelagomonas_calceolata.AAC.2